MRKRCGKPETFFLQNIRQKWQRFTTLKFQRLRTPLPKFFLHHKKVYYKKDITANKYRKKVHHEKQTWK